MLVTFDETDTNWTPRTRLRRASASHGDWPHTRTLILNALKPYPDAFEAVRQCLTEALDAAGDPAP